MEQLFDTANPLADYVAGLPEAHQNIPVYIGNIYVSMLWGNLGAYLDLPDS